jgi:hypothetical protein
VLIALSRGWVGFHNDQSIIGQWRAAEQSNKSIIAFVFTDCGLQLYHRGQ